MNKKKLLIILSVIVVIITITVIFFMNRGGTVTISGSGKGAVKIKKVEIPPLSIENEDSYVCPDDCEPGVEYDKEGNCPVCGIPLEVLVSSDVDESESRDEDPEDDEEEESDSNPDNTFNDDSK